MASQWCFCLVLVSTVQQSLFWLGEVAFNEKNTHTDTHSHPSLWDITHPKLHHLHPVSLLSWITGHAVQHCSAWERSQLSISKLSVALTHWTPGGSFNRNQTALPLCSESLALSYSSLKISLWRLTEWKKNPLINKPCESKAGCYIWITR